MNQATAAPLFHRAGIAVVESMLERIVGQDPALVRDLSALAGGRLGIECASPRLAVEIAPDSSGLRLYPELSPDCSTVIRGPAHALLELARNPQAIASIDELQVEGDIQFAERLAAAIDAADLEIEDLVASFVGDRAAQPLGQLLRSGISWLNRTGESFRLDLQEYLQEESRQLPTATEIKARGEEISALRLAVDRLEARINLLAVEDRQ